MTGMLIFDRDVCRDLIRQRKKLGHNRYDEVWEGVYIMPSVPSLEHQEIVADCVAILTEVVKNERKGNVYPGANVSDRPKTWKKNYRVPDVVVLLTESQARKFENHIFGGPDFLIEIRSPKEDPDKKLPSYSKIAVGELLIVDRDSREPSLLRHDGHDLVPVKPTSSGERWLESAVLPLAFRRGGTKAKPKLEIKRTDGVAGHWSV